MLTTYIAIGIVGAVCLAIVAYAIVPAMFNELREPKDPLDF